LASFAKVMDRYDMILIGIIWQGKNGFETLRFRDLRVGLNLAELGRLGWVGYGRVVYYRLG